MCFLIHLFMMDSLFNSNKISLIKDPELAMLSNFFPKGESNSGPSDPKLNALNHSTTDP